MITLSVSIKQSVISNVLLVGITTHTGIVGDKDDLYVLDSKIGQELTNDQAFEALYQIAKLRGKGYGSWQPVQVDTNFNQTGKLMILQEHFDPYPCKGEIIHCIPNDKLIEYIKKRCK